MADSGFDLNTAIIPDDKNSGFDINTADIGGDAFATGGFTEPKDKTEQTFLDVVDKSIGEFKSKAGKGILKTAKFLDEQTLIPEVFSGIGSKLEEVVGDDRVGQAVLQAGESAIKRAVFPTAPAHIAEKMVDEPFRTSIELAASGAIFNAPALVTKAITAVKANPLLAAKWATEIAVPTAAIKVAEKLLPEHKNVAQLTGLLVGIPAGMMAGSHIAGAKPFLNQLWKGGAKQNIKETLKKNIINLGDDVGKALDNGVNTLRAGYNSVVNANLGTVTGSTADDILEVAGLGARKQMKIILNDLKITGRKTTGKLLDVSGKQIKRKLGVGEVRDIWFNVSDSIDAAIRQGKEVTSLIKLKDHLKTVWTSALKESDQEIIKGLDDAWAVVKPRTDSIKAAVGITTKHPGVNTEKLNKLLGDKGDLTAKGWLDDMIKVDETLGPLVKSFANGLTKYEGLVAGPKKIPIKLGLVATPVSLFARMGQEAFLGLKGGAKKVVNAATLKAISRILK